jgi:hypothetical protein
MKPDRHHCIALRALCVALLLAVVAMPVLLAAGELHELDHHAQAALLPATLLIDDLRQIALVADREPSPRLSTAQTRLLRPPITG